MVTNSSEMEWVQEQRKRIAFQINKSCRRHVLIVCFKLQLRTFKELYEESHSSGDLVQPAIE